MRVQALGDRLGGVRVAGEQMRTIAHAWLGRAATWQKVAERLVQQRSRQT